MFRLFKACLCVAVQAAIDLDMVRGQNNRKKKSILNLGEMWEGKILPPTVCQLTWQSAVCTSASRLTKIVTRMNTRWDPEEMTKSD